jgi:hypothetical protein
MAKTSGITGWVKSNLMQIILLIGMSANFYLTMSYVTKTELKETVEKIQKSAIERYESDDRIHMSITANFSSIATSMAKQEYLLDVVKENQRIVSVNSIKLAEHETRLLGLERAVDKLQK